MPANLQHDGRLQGDWIFGAFPTYNAPLTTVPFLAEQENG